ncbi:MAG: helix-turn-helix domain-containing protein, partial [Muribaculaceae bacterium]|nr:helix-turn-helix domain-containing protein [Muribaculaceae bacterium]
MIKLRIKELIEDKGFTQAQVARRLDVSPMTVSGWATGKRYPSIEMLDTLAQMLDVDIVEFFGSAVPRGVTLQARVGNSTVDLTPTLVKALAALPVSP